MKEVSFKIIHVTIPLNYFCKDFEQDIEVNCSFCNMFPEDVTHLFWNCSHSNHLWKDICTFITRFIDPKFSLCIEHVLFGFFNYTSSQANQYFIINLIILLAKWHIHKCKYSNQTPLFVVFENETKRYMGNILCSRNGKAIKHVVCVLFIIFLFNLMLHFVFFVSVFCFCNYKWDRDYIILEQ